MEACVTLSRYHILEMDWSMALVLGILVGYIMDISS